MEKQLLKNRGKTGIYFLLKRKKVVYVGQTINFPKRLSGHCTKDFDSIRFIQCGKENLTKYEDRWIRLFRPKLNIKNAKADEGKPYILRLPINIYDRLSKTAERESRSLNGQIIYELSSNEKVDTSTAKVVCAKNAHT